MKPGMIIGLALLATAAGLGYWGYQESQSVANQLSSRLTGDMDTTVVMLYIAAVVCAIGGLFSIKRG